MRCSDYNNTSLESTHNHQYLGATLDDKLNWNAHVDTICAKASRMVNFVQWNLHNCPALVKAVEGINRGGAGFVKSDYNKRSSPTQMMKSLKLNTLQERR